MKTSRTSGHAGHSGTPSRGQHDHEVDLSGIEARLTALEARSASVEWVEATIEEHERKYHAAPIPGPDPTPDPEPPVIEPIPPATPRFMDRPPATEIRINGRGGPVVIENKAIRGGTVNAPKGYAIVVENAVDVTIIGVHYEHTMAGVYLVDCRGKLLVKDVKGRNVGGAVSGDPTTIGSGKGNFIQHSRCQWEGYVEDFMFVGGRFEDAVSNFQSGGMSDTRRLVYRRGYVEGLNADTPDARAWTSNSSTGIILGDGGAGSFTTVEDCTFINAGGVVLQHISGQGQITRRNTIVSEQRPPTPGMADNNQPFGSYGGSPTGVCELNRYFVTRRDGSHPDGYWPGTTMTVRGNVEDPTLTAAALRRTL